MKFSRWFAPVFIVFASTVWVGCSGGNPKASDDQSPSSNGAADTNAADSATGIGRLAVYANGEDFVRQGFTSKDGWAITFDHAYVTLADVTAYQTEPAYDPEASESLKAQEQITVAESKTVDLAEGDEQANPILIAEVDAPEGHYNALSWQMAEASDGPAAGSVLMLVGTAQKEGQTVNFTLQLGNEVTYTCGDFVGDERKGILKAGNSADLEATFHFDHIFGDGSAAPDDSLNTGALGFEPLAALASGGELVVDQATLQQSLAPEDYATLEKAVSGFGHVGEGHCGADS